MLYGIPQFCNGVIDLLIGAVLVARLGGLNCVVDDPNNLFLFSTFVIGGFVQRLDGVLEVWYGIVGILADLRDAIAAFINGPFAVFAKEGIPVPRKHITARRATKCTGRLRMLDRTQNDDDL
jgi:hypothetical protein